VSLSRVPPPSFAFLVAPLAVRPVQPRILDSSTSQNRIVDSYFESLVSMVVDDLMPIAMNYLMVMWGRLTH
jgi:hypothetical protein